MAQRGAAASTDQWAAVQEWQQQAPQQPGWLTEQQAWQLQQYLGAFTKGKGKGKAKGGGGGLSRPAAYRP